MTESFQGKTPSRNPRFPVSRPLALLTAALVIGSIVFLANYTPPAGTPPAQQLSLEQKMASLQAGAPLTSPKAALIIPWWLWALVLGFAAVQLLALVLASFRARREKLTERDLRQVEFLVETPMYLGLLGSLVGICMMQFINGSLAAPIAYLTSITGIVFYILGRFTILESLPTSAELR